MDHQTTDFFFPGAPHREIYFMALIDVLTHYGVKKQAAKAAKTVKYGSNADGISTVEPDQYGRRFLEFMNQAIVQLFIIVNIVGVNTPYVFIYVHFSLLKHLV